MREVTIGSKEGNISHCVFLSESQTTARVVVRPRVKLSDDKSIFVLWNAAGSIHSQCFPIRRASISLLTKSFSPRNWRNLRVTPQKDDSRLFFFLLTPTSRCLLPVERTVRFRGLFTFNNSTRNRIPILNTRPVLFLHCQDKIAYARNWISNSILSTARDITRHIFYTKCYSGYRIRFFEFFSYFLFSIWEVDLS